MMMVTLADLRGLRAALRLAATAHNRGILQITRVGDKLEIVGTNTYQLVYTVTDATFTDWEECAFIRIDDAAELRTLRRLCDPKMPKMEPCMTLSVEEWDGSMALVLGATRVATDDSNISWQARIKAGEHKSLNLEQFDNIKEMPNKGYIGAFTSTWRNIGELTAILSPEGCWHMRTNGTGAVFRLDEPNSGSYIVSTSIKD